MDEKRELELLAYAKVCFEKCTNPFASIHLIKKKVTADECRDLSHIIAEIIDDVLMDKEGVLQAQVTVEKANEEFMETQE